MSNRTVLRIAYQLPVPPPRVIKLIKICQHRGGVELAVLRAANYGYGFRSSPTSDDLPISQLIDKMDITFGKYQGKTSEVVVVKHGSYVKWVLGQAAAGSALGTLQTDLKRLIAVLDAKPHAGKCSYSDCMRPVAKLTAYDNHDADLYAWCATCDPYSLGANKGKLSIISNYKDALNHVALRCGATQGGYDRIVRAYAQAKGLPSRVGDSSAKKFFA